MNFYKRHLGDYAKDAGHLTMLEHGAYTLLLDRYYTTERPIATRVEAYRVCRARSAAEREAVDAVLAEFFVTDGDAFMNRRAEEEIAKASHQRTVNQEIGKRGGRPRKTESVTEPETESVSEREPNRNPTPDSKTPDTSNELSLVTERGKPRPARKCPAGFAVTAELRAWAADAVPGVDLEAQTAMLRDHTFKNAISDWPGAWRNWMRRAYESRPVRAPAVVAEPAWKREQRERMAAFGGAPLKDRTTEPETVDVAATEVR